MTNGIQFRKVSELIILSSARAPIVNVEKFRLNFFANVFYFLAKYVAFGIAGLGMAALIYRSYENRLDEMSSRIDGLLDDPRSRLSTVEDQVAALTNSALIRQSELDNVEANLASETSRVDTTCARVIHFFINFFVGMIKIIV